MLNHNEIEQLLNASVVELEAVMEMSTKSSSQIASDTSKGLPKTFSPQIISPRQNIKSMIASAPSPALVPALASPPYLPPKLPHHASRWLKLDSAFKQQTLNSTSLTEFGRFMMRKINEEGIRRAMKGGRDAAIDLCLSHLNDMSEATFTTRISQYTAALKARKIDADKLITREGLCDKILHVLEKVSVSE